MKFDWSDLGNIQEGRPNLGDTTLVAVYRLFQYTLRDVLEEHYGIERTEELLKEAGYLAGREFARSQLDLGKPVTEMLADLQRKMLEMRIGILRVEKADLENLAFTLTVSEDLDCSGLPLKGKTVCNFDEGMIAGIMEEYASKRFDAKEIDCWTTGARTCRFVVRPV
ncbi:MAG: V4R domain protein [Methanomassiliicoccales archaeon PtaU1.Bin124]|nr:MAG: V4R domain protein [Methanomassiliicoccales archaeon PtaU1.Bin124]